MRRVSYRYTLFQLPQVVSIQLSSKPDASHVRKKQLSIQKYPDGGDIAARDNEHNDRNCISMFSKQLPCGSHRDMQVGGRTILTFGTIVRAESK